MPILRVFPRKTNATPQDEYVAIGSPGLFVPDDISEIHISVTFTWDLREAEILAQQWSHYGNVKIGGSTTGMCGEAFIPGLYLKQGYVITSRGCHNHCWFCSVPVMIICRLSNMLLIYSNRLTTSAKMFCAVTSSSVIHDWRKFQRLRTRPATIYSPHWHDRY